MKRLGLALCICMVGAQVGLAQNEAKLKLAHELLNAMNFQGQMEKSCEVIRQTMPSYMKSAMEAMGQTNAASHAAQAGFSDGFDQAMKEVCSSPEWSELGAEMATIYADVLSEEELTQVIAFYKSPAGKSLLDKQPEIMRRSMVVNQKLMTTIMPRLQATMQKKHANQTSNAPAKTE